MVGRRLLVCDRVRRRKDSRKGACWCVTGSEEGRIVGKGPVGVLLGEKREG